MRRSRKKRSKRIGVLPSLLTLGNLLCGFGAIAYASVDKYSEAGWLILIAMIFDALDGRIARMANLTSKFGAELDSLADIVTFGVAPAVLAKVISAQHLGPRLLWPMCALYLACAALRLARFNVETRPDPKAHMQFRGLPTPAAGGFVAALVILGEHLTKPDCEVFGLSVPEGIFEGVVPLILPAAMVVLGALMVSRVAYPHLMGRVLSGRRPFMHFVEIVFVGILAAVEIRVFLAGAFIFYFLLGPVSHVARKLRRSREEPVPSETFEH